MVCAIRFAVDCEAMEITRIAQAGGGCGWLAVQRSTFNVHRSALGARR